MNSMKDKTLVLVLCFLGVLAVGYGMVNRNHPVFVAGLVLVIAGYLMMRKKLKTYIREKYTSEGNGKRTKET
jgi:hypothetical protein